MENYRDQLKKELAGLEECLKERKEVITTGKERR